jgi:hypothetical protein
MTHLGESGIDVKVLPAWKQRQQEVPHGRHATRDKNAAPSEQGANDPLKRDRS